MLWRDNENFTWPDGVCMCCYVWEEVEGGGGSEGNVLGLERAFLCDSFVRLRAKGITPADFIQEILQGSWFTNFSFRLQAVGDVRSEPSLCIHNLFHLKPCAYDLVLLISHNDRLGLVDFQSWVFKEVCSNLLKPPFCAYDTREFLFLLIVHLMCSVYFQYWMNWPFMKSLSLLCRGVFLSGMKNFYQWWSKFCVGRSDEGFYIIF